MLRDKDPLFHGGIRRFNDILRLNGLVAETATTPDKSTSTMFVSFIGANSCIRAHKRQTKEIRITKLYFFLNPNFIDQKEVVAFAKIKKLCYRED